LTNRQERIRSTLNAVFSPSLLEIVDDSARHAGHAGASAEGESHYTVRIAADSLSELGRIGAHRAVNDALKNEFETGLHALSIRILPPDFVNG